MAARRRRGTGAGVPESTYRRTFAVTLLANAADVLLVGARTQLQERCLAGSLTGGSLTEQSFAAYNTRRLWFWVVTESPPNSLQFFPISASLSLDTTLYAPQSVLWTRMLRQQP